jgi:cytochrome c biogenesis protein CcdA
MSSVTSLLAIVALGFAMGMRHACDADHVVAVSTIVARHRRVGVAALVGAVWGIGHAITILMVGAAIIMFSVVVPPRLGLSLELSVGVMLIVLGLMNLAGVTHRLFHRFGSTAAEGPDQPGHLLHSHAHSHGAWRHSHPHLHILQRGHTTLGTFGLVRALAVGTVHGLAGSAAVALLVLSTIRNPFWSAVYLGVFGLGTIAGMMLISIGIAVPLAVGAPRFAKLERLLVPGSGLVSLAFGLFMVAKIGFWDRLF